jgi:hypothetical protein
MNKVSKIMKPDSQKKKDAFTCWICQRQGCDIGHDCGEI